MRKKSKILLICLVLIVLFIYALSKQLTIEDIMENPGEYEGKIVKIKGEFKGWESSAPPPITTVNWVLKDETGEIYVVDPFGEHIPTYLGQRITVEGVVRISNISNSPYIEVKSVKY